MLKQLPFVIILSLSSLLVRSQSLVLSQDTFSFSGPLADQFDHEEVNGYVTNTGSSVDTVHWYVTAINQPSSWELSACDINNCYIISSADGTVFTFVAGPGVDNLFYFGVTPYCEAGFAEMEVLMWLNSDSAGSAKTLRFEAEYTGNCTSGIKDELAGAVKVYPTIFQSNLMVDASDIGKLGRIKMFDALGNVVMESRGNSAKAVILSTSNLTSGVYILRIETSLGLITKRVVKE